MSTTLSPETESDQLAKRCEIGSRFSNVEFAECCVPTIQMASRIGCVISLNWSEKNGAMMSDGAILFGEMIGWGCVILLIACAIVFGLGLGTGWLIWG